MALIQTVHLSMANFKSAPVVPAVQNDTDRQVKMIIDDFQLTAGLTGKIAFQRSDGTHYETAATLNTSDNSFTADIDQALTQPGRTMVQLKVTDTLTVSTFSFVIFVEQDNSGTVTPQEGIDLVSAVQAAEDAADRAESAAQSVDADEIWNNLNDINSCLSIDSNVEVTLTTGKFINAQDDGFANSSGFAYTNPIPVLKGQTVIITATGYNQIVGMIALCNADNTQRHVVVSSIDGQERTYTYTIENDGYIACSFYYANNTPYKIKLLIDYYDLVKTTDALNVQTPGTRSVPITETRGYFIDSSGNVQSSSNFAYTQSIPIYKGQTISLTARGYITAVAMISTYDPESNTYHPKVMCIDSTDRTYVYTAVNDKEIIRCSYNWYGGGQVLSRSITITTSDTIIGAIYDMSDGDNSIIQYPQMFSNIICMGDSLTKGYDGSGDTPLVTNYPFYFKKLTQAEITNQSQGGITTTQFWDTYADDYDYTPYDCAIIFLGTNGGLTDSVSTDCHEDYTQNANTQTGSYGKIIGRIKATAPKCKIFVVAGVNDYVRRATTMNPAVRSLAEFYGVGLIDVENCIMADIGAGGTAERYLYRPIDGIHYNRLGYLTLANLFYDSMSKYMSEHLTAYDD